jgi:adenosylcobinamide-phosphate synthase
VALFSLIIALLLEQVLAPNPAGPVGRLLDRWADAVARGCNAGQRSHGVFGWLAAVVPLVVAGEVVFLLLSSAHALLGLAWSVAVLHFTMGLRRFSRGYGEVLESLRADQLDEARRQLAAWRGQPAAELSSAEVAKAAIEGGLAASHRYAFGVMAWFVFLPALFGTLLPGPLGTLLSGPGGALLYALSARLERRWAGSGEAIMQNFGSFAGDAFRALDWLPVRLTALSFAIVGDFEDAVYCWRTQAAAWPDRGEGIVLAAGAGAIGVRLGEALHLDGSVALRPELGLGEEADVEHMQGARGLVWRALVLWLLLIGLLTLANWAG